MQRKQLWSNNGSHLRTDKCSTSSIFHSNKAKKAVRQQIWLKRHYIHLNVSDLKALIDNCSLYTVCCELAVSCVNIFRCSIATVSIFSRGASRPNVKKNLPAKSPAGTRLDTTLGCKRGHSMKVIYSGTFEEYCCTCREAKLGSRARWMQWGKTACGNFSQSILVLLWTNKKKEHFFVGFILCFIWRKRILLTRQFVSVRKTNLYPEGL